MVYCEGVEVDSKLGKYIQAFRCDRPDEWTMDEFIRIAEDMHKEITRLREAERDAARYLFMRDMSDEVDVSRFFYIDVSERDAEIDQAMKEKGDE